MNLHSRSRNRNRSRQYPARHLEDFEVQGIGNQLKTLKVFNPIEAQNHCIDQTSSHFLWQSIQSCLAHQGMRLDHASRLASELLPDATLFVKERNLSAPSELAAAILTGAAHLGPYLQKRRSL